MFLACKNSTKVLSQVNDEGLDVDVQYMVNKYSSFIWHGRYTEKLDYLHPVSDCISSISSLRRSVDVLEPILY